MKYIEELIAYQEDIDATQIAEILWLSQFMVGESSKIEEPKPTPNRKSQEIKEPIEDLQPIEESETINHTPTPQKQKTNYGFDKEQEGSTYSTHIAKKEKFPNIEKQFSSLRVKQKKISKKSIDEIKTADYIATTGYFHPIFSEVKSKRSYFTLHIIIDRSESIFLWESYTQHFIKSMKFSKTFKKIRIFELNSSKKEPSITILNSHSININSATFREDKSLTLIFSDITGISWKSNRMFEVLDSWSKGSFVAIVSMLPKRMWKKTPLRQGISLFMKPTRFLPKNRNLKAEFDFIGIKPNQKVTNIPLLTFDSYSFSYLSNVLMGKKGSWIDSRIFKNLTIKQVPKPKKSNILPSQRVKNFFSFALPKTRELAIYCSVLPLDNDIIREIIKARDLGNEKDVFAEFYFGGLLDRDVKASLGEYAFYDGVAKELRQYISIQEFEILLGQVSGVMSRSFGVDYQKINLLFETVDGGVELNDNERALVELMIEVLGDKGRFYEGEVEKLKKIIDSDKDLLDLSQEASKEYNNMKIEYNPENANWLPIGYKIGNRYEILRVLGQGGFGIVYLVKDLKSETLFVIKELFITHYSFRTRRELSVIFQANMKEIISKIQENIKDEIRIFFNIKHKNIVQFYGYLSENNTIYSIMEYINGTDLEEYTENSFFNEDKAKILLKQILSSLKEIHKKNIIHCDIKPSNILLTKDGVYKLIDFTTNRIFSENEIRITAIGTPIYVAPELQKSKSIIGKFTDIYSLGMTLIKILSVVKQLPNLTDRLIDDSEFQSIIDELNVSNKFKHILKKMTELKIKDRYQSIEEIGEELNFKSIQVNELNIMGSYNEEIPEEILFLEKIDINNCVSDKINNIDDITKEIWKGQKGIINRLIFLFDTKNHEYRGVEDILKNWQKDNIKTVLFYIPRRTVKEIRQKLRRKLNTKSIFKKIKDSLITQCQTKMPTIIIHDFDDLNTNIFDNLKIKNDFDKDSKISSNIYFIGLKFNLTTNDKIGCYLNNIPIYENSKLIVGNSNMLKYKLRKGFISISYNENIEIKFFNTNEFTSEYEDLRYIDFYRDSLDIELSDNPIIFKSKKDNTLFFSKKLIL